MARREHEAASEVAESLPSRLVFSLLLAAVRLAARVQMPLGRLTSLLRTAYFLEHRRRHPRDLATVARKLGVSLRTAGTLNRSLKDDFYAPENRVEPLRQVTAELMQGACTAKALEEATGLDEAEVERAVVQLTEVGWVTTTPDGRLALASNLRSYLPAAADPDALSRRVDGINHQMSVLAESVWTRFVQDDTDAAGARTWAFAARPEDVAAAMERAFADLRQSAVDMETAALAEDAADDDGAPDHAVGRFGITVAFAPLEDDP